MDAATLITRHEGIRLLPYTDSRGVLSIGIGRNLRDRGISEQEAYILRDNDITACRTFLQTYDWFAALTPTRQAVLLDMVFNLGKGGFQGFKQLIAAAAAGNHEGVADAMVDSNWAKQVPQRVLEDAELYRNG